MWIDVDQTAIDFAKRRPAVDRRNRLLKWPVVEHRAVEKRGRGRIDAGAQVVWKGLGDEFRAPRPASFPLRHHLAHFHDSRGRKGARERRGRTRGEGKTWRVVEAEVALDLAVRVPPIAEVQYVMVLALMDERRVVDLHRRPGRASAERSTATSAFSSHRSRNASMGKSWLKARASMVPLMPPAEAPAMISTTTRISTVRPISRSSSK